MEKHVFELLNDQINKELYSAYLYLDIANYYDDKGLDGFANWYEIQAKEEMDHAMLIYHYLHNNDQSVTLKEIAKPDKIFTDLMGPLKIALEHEKYVTSLINNIYAAAQGVNDFRGLDACITSTVPGGSGLSSSAAFEVLIGTMLNELFFGGRCTPVELAQIGQYAENVFFGKPCGLMDQTASSVGGVVAIDFADTAHPTVEQISLDLTAAGYGLCILDSAGKRAIISSLYHAVDAIEGKTGTEIC